MIRTISRPAAFAAMALAGAVGLAKADVATLAPAKDNTLFQPVADPTSNGAGPDLYVGRTAFNGSRRAVLAFDLSSIPASATVNAATLTISVTRSPQGGRQEDVSLRRLSADWGEGASMADGGDGDPAMPGDATWANTFYPSSFWTNPGGDFSATTSATRHLAGLGAYAISSSTMAADVQSWLANPTTNFGWILIGDEAFTQTARRLGSRENPDVTLRPNLVVTYSVPEPTMLVAFTPFAMLMRRSRRR